MKMRQPIALLLLLSTLAIAGCRSVLTVLHPTPTLPPTPIAARPDSAAETFLRAWERADYTAMYGLLAPSAKAQVSGQDFEEWYHTSLTEAAVTSLRAQVRSALESGYSAQIDFTVIMQSAVLGAIEFDYQMALSFEANRWGVVCHRNLFSLA